MDKDKAEPRITITVNGPYRVDGELPLTPKRMVTSEQGEPLAWATDPAIPHESPVFLCRCGQSRTKPFCDGSHERVGFDGTETATEATFEDCMKTYEGPGITVRRVGSICQHAGFCENRNTDWYRLVPDSDQIGARTQLIAMIEHCPSGALVYELDGEVVEPDLPKAISPVDDGPYWVTGGIRVTRSDGIEMEVRNRVTLCRCGQSKNKPLCDGAHFDIGFVARSPSSEPETPGVDRTIPVLPAAVYRQILVGVGASVSDAVIGAAAQLATATSAQVSLAHAGTGPEVDLVLAAARQLMVDSGVPTDKLNITQLSGHPGGALEGLAEDLGAGLIVLGRGESGLDRTPHEVAYHSPCDLLLVSDGIGPEKTYERILIATNGSVTADRAAKRGYSLARALGASVDIVFVGHHETGKLVVEDTISVIGEGVETRAVMLQGDPAERILETAVSSEADLLVVGNKGLTRARSLLGGSVPGRVLKGATCDVLLSRTVRQLESELEPGEGGVIERHGEKLAAYVDESGKLHLMSARCSHLGCVVAWDPAERNFECPCHGSRFSPLGDVVNGPATEPLHQL